MPVVDDVGLVLPSPRADWSQLRFERWGILATRSRGVRLSCLCAGRAVGAEERQVPWKKEQHTEELALLLQVPPARPQLTPQPWLWSWHEFHPFCTVGVSWLLSVLTLHIAQLAPVPPADLATGELVSKAGGGVGGGGRGVEVSVFLGVLKVTVQLGLQEGCLGRNCAGRGESRGACPSPWSCGCGEEGPSGPAVCKEARGIWRGHAVMKGLFPALGK